MANDELKEVLSKINYDTYNTVHNNMLKHLDDLITCFDTIDESIMDSFLIQLKNKWIKNREQFMNAPKLSKDDFNNEQLLNCLNKLDDFKKDV